MFRKFFIGFVAFLVLNVWAQATTNKPIVFVSLEVQEGWVKKIAGDKVVVESLIKAGTNAHTYEPKPSTMKQLARASLLLGIGIEFEEVWFLKFQQLYPNIKIVKLDEKMNKIENDEHAHAHHEHDEFCEHGHFDPHVWLSVVNAKIAADKILEALINTDGANEAEYRANYAKFIAELDALHSELSSKLAPLKGAKFMVFHPTWGYFARDYDLVQVPIEVGGKEPKPAQLQKLIKAAKEQRVRTIFVQRGFSQKAARQLAQEIGARVLETDPLSARWAEGMRSFAEAISATK